MASPVNLAENLSLAAGHYQPHIVGAFNHNDLMVVRIKGPFTWHWHDDTEYR